MSKIFLTSDCHFQNENIIRYCNRPFINSADQTEQLIANWNLVVAEGDKVVCLGDFIMGSTDGISEILSRLNGHITLVVGNHDTPSKLDIYRRNYPNKITVQDIFYTKCQGFYFVCCHFPMTNPEFFDMVRSDNSEVVMCHGHLHDKVPFYTPETRTFNLSVDVTNFTPVNIHHIAALIHFNE